MIDSALLGHFLSFTLINKLAGLGIISRETAAEVFDETLSVLEDMQAVFPEDQQDFEAARGFLEKAVANLPPISAAPPWNN